MSRYRIAVITATVAAFLGTSSLALAAKPKVAILGLEVVQDSAMDVKTAKFSTDLTDALRKRASVGAGPFRLAPNSNKALLEVKFLGGCESEANDCMAKIGKTMKAAQLIYGKIEKKRDKGYQVTLKLLDVKTAKLTRSTTELIAFDDVKPARINEWARRLYNRLTGLSDQGGLKITANVQTGTVLVNGQVKGSLAGGAAQINGLPEGKLELKIESDGYEPFVTEVSVAGGATASVEATLAVEGSVGSGKSGGAGTSKMLFYGTAGLAAAGAVVATITGLQVKGSLEDAKNDAIRDYQDVTGTTLDVGDACSHAKMLGNAPGVVSACDAGKSRATLTNVMWGVTAVSAAAAGFFYYKGYLKGGESSSSETASNSAKRAPTVQITPTVMPTYVGAGVQIEF